MTTPADPSGQPVPTTRWAAACPRCQHPESCASGDLRCIMPYLEPDPRTQPDDPSVMDALHRAYRMWQSEGNEQLAVGIIREAFAEAHAAAPPSPEPTGAGTPTLGFVLLDKMGGCYRSHVYHRRDDAEKALQGIVWHSRERYAVVEVAALNGETPHVPR